MNIEKVSATAGRFLMLKNGFDNSISEMEEICSETKQRIKEERERDCERIEELKGITNGVAGELAAGEIQQLEEKQYHKNETEIRCFSDATNRAKECMREMRQAQTEYLEQRDMLKKELQEFDNSILKKVDFILLDRWLDSSKKDFERLGG